MNIEALRGVKIYNIKEIKREKLLLSPKTGEAMSSEAFIQKAITKLKCPKVGERYIILKSDIDRWNNAVKIIKGYDK